MLVRESHSAFSPLAMPIAAAISVEQQQQHRCYDVTPDRPKGQTQQLTARQQPSKASGCDDVGCWWSEQGITVDLAPDTAWHS